ncbi:MAG TPA: PAS domain-containing protein, partial [Hyphomicrobiales bacterium]|nr:PAS domain-containing protein [Hyphomicrobiales bacterium]
MQRANEAAEIGSFIIDLGVNSLRCSSNFAGFFGLQEVETQSLFGTLARIHREDAARVCESYQVAARGEDGGRVNVEFKVDQPDGGIRWLACRGRIEFRIDDEGKRPHRIAGVCFDITDRKKAEASLRENAELFQEIANVAPVLIWMSDTAKACTWFNKPWVDFTGRTMEEELGDGWTEGVHPED